MIITDMTEAEVDEVSALETEIFSMPWSRQGFLDVLPMPNVLFLVAKEAGHVIGYCGIYIALDEGEITNVAVNPQNRKEGTGEKLVRALIEEAAKEGVKRYVLEVRVSNQAAIHLYEKTGFKSVGIRKDFYERPVEDAYVMIREE